MRMRDGFNRFDQFDHQIVCLGRLVAGQSDGLEWKAESVLVPGGCFIAPAGRDTEMHGNLRARTKRAMRRLPPTREIIRYVCTRFC